MKRYICLIILFLTIILVKNVNAANYELKELIPIGTKTTIVTKHFSYKQIVYDNAKGNDKIHFTGIKNIYVEELPISISIALFDKNKKNIGVVNYCAKESKILQPKEEIEFDIKIKKTNLGEKNTIKDIKYISVLEDNYTCKTGGSTNYLGKKIDDIGKYQDGELSDSSKLAVQIIGTIAAVIVVLFLYQFLFTNKFNNMDGNDVRNLLKDYKNDEARANTFSLPDDHAEMPDGITIVNKSKSAEMADKEAEENEKSNRKDNDLMNMYK